MEIKIHTIFLSYDGLCDPLGASQILPYLCGLAKTKRYHIHIVSAEKPHANRAQAQGICNQHGISWHPVTFRSKIKGFSAWRNLKSVKRMAQRVNNEFPIQIVHARSLPMAIIAAQITRNKRAKVVFDMRGFWVNERSEGGIWNLKNPVYNRMYKKMLIAENKLLINAHSVVTLTHEAKKHILSSNSEVNSGKIRVVPCAVDLTLFDGPELRAQRTKLREKYGFTNQFVVTYSGSLGTWYMLDEMMLFFSMLKEKNPNAVFNIISKDTAYNVQQLENKYHLPAGSVRIQSANRAEMPEALICSDIGLFFIRPTFAKKGSSPTKLAEFLALGIPVISNKGIGDMDEQFYSHQLGFLLNIFSNEELQRAITFTQNLNEFSIENCIDFARSFYSLDKAVDTYQSIYNQLTSDC
ncbi:MAG: glycosyltransferase [Flavobacteriales bacterium]